ncbi:hypothetical protein BCR43DRAFT_552653 [Syncephalastrum racemosum]|uniref:PQ loop repeat-domain-containing protein n=1 Tax=Syncephalastrum racemosum TaxID=13706 RepID=A0A1X2H485_SYNRA|nr:hypothetical protein BCR43DRAFT_552653 [Syncephalastrum racemosum]
MSPIIPFAKCNTEHDPVATFISVFLCIGLVISYLPQHYRIIANKTSDGFNAWFLLLGVVSSTSSFFNIILLQWDSIVCCLSVEVSSSHNGRFVLFLLYFPNDRKRRSLPVPETTSEALQAALESKSDLSDEWRLSLLIAVLCLAHLAISFFITVVLLIFVGGPQENAWTNYWAGFLGVLSMVLASFQYIPQIYTTWRRKTVGALSIPMMLLQTPGKTLTSMEKIMLTKSYTGSALFVYSLAVRPGTNWTAWITYLVTGLLQGTLLVMCIAWRIRNRRLGIDDLHGNAAEDTPDERTRLLRD